MSCSECLNLHSFLYPARIWGGSDARARRLSKVQVSNKVKRDFQLGGWYLRDNSLSAQVCIVVAVFFFMLCGLLEVGRLFCIRTCISILLESADVNDLNMLIIYYAGLAILDSMLFFSGVHLASYAMEGKVKRLRMAFLDTCLSLPPRHFTSKKLPETNDNNLPKQLEDAVLCVREGGVLNLFWSIFYFVSITGSIIFALTLTWELTLILLATEPISLLAYWYLKRSSINLQNQQNRGYQVANLISEESISQICTVSSYSLEQEMEIRYSNSLVALEKTLTKPTKIYSLAYGSIVSFAYLQIAIAIFYGGRIIAASSDISVTAANVCQATMVVLGMISSLIAVLHPSTSVEAAGQSIRRVKRFVDSCSTENNNNNNNNSRLLDKANLCLSSSTFGIQFDNVSFAYPENPDKLVLRNLSISIPHGKTTALVGKTGSGKSTITKLILQQYNINNITSGCISINGIPLNRLSMSNFRKQTSVVSQNTPLFSASIRENIALGSTEKVDDAAIWKALEMSSAKKFVENLPEKLDTQVGCEGKGLSGGQKQRICIAQALIRNPKFLILDEPTASLDSISQKEVQKSIDRITEECNITVLVVAHNIATVRNADKIIVIGEGGEILQQGTHETLLSDKTDDTYRRFSSQQTILSQEDLDFLSSLSPKKNDANNPDNTDNNNNINNNNNIDDDDVLSDDEFFLQTAPPGFFGKNDNRKESIASTALPDDFDNFNEEHEFIDDTKVGNDEIVVTDSSTKPNSLCVQDIPLSYKQFLKGINKFVDTKLIFLLIITSILSGMTGLFYAFALGQFLQASRTNDIISHTQFWAFVSLGFSVYGGTMYGLCMYVRNKAQQCLMKTARTRAFHSILYKSMEFHDRKPYTELVDLLSSQIQTVGSILSNNLSEVLQTLSVLTAAFVFGFIVLPEFTAQLIPIAVLFLFAVVLSARTNSKSFKREKPDSQASAAFVSDVINNIHIVQHYELKSRILTKYEQEICSMKNQTANSNYKFLAISRCIVTLLPGLMFWLAGIPIRNGHSSGTCLVVCLAFLLAFYICKSTAGVDFAKAKKASAELFDICEIHSKETEGFIQMHSGKCIDLTNKTSSSVHLELSNVSFSYSSRPDVQVLKDVSLEANSGETVAIVGPSGSGKSSIANILQRFYPYTSGSVTFNNHEIGDIQLKSYRKCIAMVSQDTELFNVSVIENIRYGKPEATLAEVIHAAELSRASDFICTLPKKYNTIIGYKGRGLSGGQRQQLCLARAIIRRAPLIVLDEATSALDSNSEFELQQAFSDLGSIYGYNPAKLIIAHRLTTVVQADNIIVLNKHEKGSFVEDRGSHIELLRKTNSYYSQSVVSHHMC